MNAHRAVGVATSRAPIASRIVFSTEARGLSGRSALTPREQATEAEVKSIALAQPHRKGVSDLQADAWMASILGRFCCSNWRDRDTQHDYWQTGERYARLIDAERIARGMPPRQCAEGLTVGDGLTTEEQMEIRIEREAALRGAEDAMRTVDRRAPKAIRAMAWEDREIGIYAQGLCIDALYALSVHFEALDKPKLRRYGV